MAPTRVRLGDLLVEAQIITREQLDEVLALQRQDGRRLGTLLVECGLVSETQVTQILSQQLSVPWVSLYHIDFSRQLLNLVPRDVAERYCLVPIFVRRVRGLGDALYVAMDDPSDEAAQRDVQQYSGLNVRAMIAPPSDIRSAIRVYYGGKSATPSLSEAVAEAERSSSAAPAAARPVLESSIDVAFDSSDAAITSEAIVEVRAPAPEGEAPGADSVPAVESQAIVEIAPPPPEVAPRKEPPPKPKAEVEPSVATVPLLPDGLPSPPAEASAPKQPSSPPAAAPISNPPAAPTSRPPSAPISRPPSGAHAPISRPPAAPISSRPRAPASEVPTQRLTPSPESTRLAARQSDHPKPISGAAQKMLMLTLLDGTTVNLPARGKTETAAPGAREELTARDLIAALRAVSHGADATEILGDNARWEALFAALLNLLIRKHLIADWEFVEEFKKV